MKVTQRQVSDAQKRGGYGRTFDKVSKTAVSHTAPDFFLIPQVSRWLHAAALAT